MALTASEVRGGVKRPELSCVRRPEDQWGLMLTEEGWDNIHLEMAAQLADVDVDVVIAHCSLFGGMWASILFMDQPELFKETELGYHRLVVCVACKKPIEANSIIVDFPYGSSKWDSAFTGPAFFCDCHCLAVFQADDDCDCKVHGPPPSQEHVIQCVVCKEDTSSYIDVYLPQRSGAGLEVCSSACICTLAKKGGKIDA